MIGLHTAPPKLALREFVRVYAQREVTDFRSGAAYLTELIPARLEQTLEFQFGVPYTVHHSLGYDLTTPAQAIVGAQVRSGSSIDLKPGVICFGVFFLPTGLSRLLGLPVTEFSHRSFDARLVRSDLRALRDRLGNCQTFPNRVRLMEDFLLKLAARARTREPMHVIADHLFVRRGVVESIERVAADAGLGIRQFERLFRRDIGISPKLYARVTRFQTALDMKIATPGRTWLEIAHRLNYHDQMHMIRDFQLLGGNSPGELLAHIGDGRPSAVAGDDTQKKYFSE